MNIEIKRQWIEALRSGDYPQGKNYLQDVDGNFCCLGVLCDLAVKAGVIPPPGPPVYGDPHFEGYQYATERWRLPGEVIAWAGLGNFGSDPYIPLLNTNLSALNDKGTPFPLLANTIQEAL